MTFDPTQIHQVSNYLFRGPRPPSYDWLNEHGFKRVINLESGVFQFLHKDAYYDQDLMFGIMSMQFHWSDIFAPKKFMLETVANLMRLAMDDKVKTYIHCLHGEDRTGMACAAYRIIYQGWGFDVAVDEMKQLGFHTFPYWFWINNLRGLK